MASSKKALGATLLSAIMVLTALAAPALAVDTTNVAFVQTRDGAASIPVGHAEFCRQRPQECGPNAQVIPAMPLTEALWQQLLNVNAQVNAAVVPVTDEQLYKVSEYWTYPNGYGDCEDYALEKRRELINLGWPTSTLLLTVVKQPNGEGHAVLTVRTDRGDLVLDNQIGSVDLWNATPYKFIKRQSQANAGQWVDMIDDRDIVVATAAIR